MLKLEQANVHLQNLEREIEDWRKDQASKVSHDLDTRAGKYVVHTVIKPLPLSWSLILGDCVQNLRAALDHLIYELTTKMQGEVLSEDVARRLEFPIFGDRCPRPGEWSAKVGLIAPGAIKIIDGLQPYKRGDDYGADLLWALHELSRFDKHRYIQLTASAVKGGTFTAINAEFARAGVWGGGALRTGRKEQLAHARFRRVNPKPEPYLHYDPTFDIAFGQGRPGYGKYVVEALSTIRDYIASDVFSPLSDFL